MTLHSVGADLKARLSLTLLPGKVHVVPTGVWIDSIDWEKIPARHKAELQIRARSSLSYKKGLLLANGVGTVDLDYPDEIGVLLFNSCSSSVEILEGERIAQILLAVHPALDDATYLNDRRTGGFGSTSITV